MGGYPAKAPAATIEPTTSAHAELVKAPVPSLALAFNRSLVEAGAHDPEIDISALDSDKGGRARSLRLDRIPKETRLKPPAKVQTATRSGVV